MSAQNTLFDTTPIPAQASLFDSTPIAPPPTWERRPGPIGQMSATWLHVASGMIVRHCGHPTANFPYYIDTPWGEYIYAPNGRGFQNLAMAKTAAEALHLQRTSN